MDGCPQSGGVPTFQVRVLASGSNGNCVFLRAGDTRLLLDVGISRRRIIKALWEIGEELDAIDAIFVTHEHGDHIHALTSVMAKHPHVPVHCTAGTAASVDVPRAAFGADRVQAGEPFFVGRVQMTPFATSHDAAEPVGVRCDVDGFSFAYVTDLGRVTNEVERVLTGAQVILLESNYDEEMLWNGPYPRQLKRRVASARGHLSNRQAAQLLSRLGGEKLQSVILGHLSAKNNDPGKALDTVAVALDGRDGVALAVADRKTPGALMTFSPVGSVPPPAPVRQLALW
jgi:phosphoribosyl 1,2-cyclic phosphodiesterase